jgi:plasmid segregation protein ParM
MTQQATVRELSPGRAAKTKPVIVGVDDGYASTKIVIFGGQEMPVVEFAIPSRARSGEQGIASIDDRGDGKTVSARYETENVKFSVGDFADSESSRFDEYPYSKMNRVIVHHALRVAGLAGRPVRIATGLPFSSYYKNQARNAELIAKKDASIRLAVAATDATPTAQIVDHRVYAEGVGAWIDAVIDNDGKGNRDLLNQHVGIIDIGGRTTDIVVMLPNRIVDFKRSGSAEIGVSNVIEAVAEAALAKFGTAVPHYMIEQALRTGKVTLWSRPEDISDLIRAAVASAMDRLAREVSKRLGSGIDLDRVLLVGGGAHVFVDAAKFFPHLQVVPNPEFANARGFAKFLGTADE